MAVKHASDVRLGVFACEAGMGSRLIGANQLKKKLSALGRDIRVIHSPVNKLRADAAIAVEHETRAERASKAAPARAVVLKFKNFMNKEASDRLLKSLQAGEDITSEASTKP